MRWRFLGAALGCAARAGVDVLARRTGVRVRLVLAVEEAVFFLAAGRLVLVVRFLVVECRFLLVAVRCLLAAVRFLLFAVLLEALLRFGFAAAFRDVERTEPFVFLREPAAFNFFPLFWIVAPDLEQDAQKRPGSASLPRDFSRGSYGDPTFFQNRSRILDCAFESA